MCRAVWVMIVGPTPDANKALRRAAGPDAQVVAMATDADEALSFLSSSPPDVIVLSSDLEDATTLAASIRSASPKTAIVWVGAGQPEQAHAWVEEAGEALEGAITRGLLAARAAK